jgi:hypothetical protein
MAAAAREVAGDGKVVNLLSVKHTTEARRLSLIGLKPGKGIQYVWQQYGSLRNF